MASIASRPLIGHSTVLLMVGLCFGLTAYAGITLTRDTGRIAAVWVPNAILLTILLRTDRGARWPLVLVCMAANLAANLAVGDLPALALGLSVINASEVVVALLALNRLKVIRPNFTEHREIGFFALVSVFSSTVSAAMASIFLTSSINSEIFPIFWEWFRADALGLLIVTPAITILADAWSRRHKLTRRMVLEGALVIGIGTSISVYTFWQTRFPFLFLDAPIVLLYAFRLGSLGNAIAILNLAIVASVATTFGHGPINLVQGDFSDKLFVLQLFLASSFAIGLPIAALLRGKRLAEERFRQIAELSPVGIFRTSSSNELRYANAAFWERAGGKEKLDQSPIWQSLAQVSQGQNEFAILDDNTGRTLRVRTQGIVNDNGEGDGLLGAVVDITTETAAQKRLLEAKRTFETLTDLSPAGIFRTAADGNCTYVNRAWERLAGIDGFCAIGKGWISSLHPEDRQRVEAAWQNATANGADYADEFRFLHADGSVRWGAVLARPERQSDGRITAYIGVALDITDRKSTEVELMEARRMADEAAASKAQFLANMSHEIRTPMNGVLGFAQILEQENLDASQKRMVEMIIQSGKSMLELLNDILDISKMEAGKFKLEPKAVDAPKEILTAVDGLRAIAQAKGIDLTCNLSAAVPRRIEIDPLRLRQILNNVIGNAIKFTDEGSVSVYVSVEGCDDGETLKIRVTDTGIGIAPDKLELIFGYFDQAETGVTDRFGGSGLGLAITKNLIAGFGGSVDVQSELGCGSTFNIRLPLIRLPDGCDTGKSDHLTVDLVTNDAASDMLRILVAEDNEINALVLQSMLERLDVHATFASNGVDVIQCVEEYQTSDRPFDLILMDIRMPEMDGYEATRQLRRNGYSAEDLPIVALTANSFPEDVEECRLAGMQAHLSKPLEFEDLREALARFSPRAQKRSEPSWGGSDRLKLAFEAQRSRLFNNLAKFSASMEEAVRQDLIFDMHQLAGTAAYFGEDRLGEVCREGEVALQGLTGPELPDKLHELFASQGFIS